MNRRNTLKTIAGVSAGAVAIGYWAIDWKHLQDLMSNSFFKPSEQDLITSIADTFIPKGQFYGAVDLGVPIFLLKYFEKCEEKEIQDNLKLQLKALNTAANQQFKNDFVDCTQVQREGLLLKLSESTDEKVKTFFDLMKRQTIRGFQTTEEVMVNHYNYRVIPGHYRGCVGVEEEAIS